MFFDNEENVKEENMDSLKQTNINMAIFGYTKCETDFFETKSYEMLMLDMIKNKKEFIYNYNLPFIPTKIIKDEAKKLLIEQTKDINRKVLYLESDDKVIYDFISEYGDIDESKYEELIKYIKKKARKKEVTNLPINWVIDTQRNGHSKIVVPCEIYEEEFLRKLPIISTGINMINQNDEIGISVLIHEMTHALTDKNKGIIENYLNHEVLSIYMELISSLDFEEEILIKQRLQYLKNNIIEKLSNNYNGYINNLNDAYIISSLKAFNLFEKYKNASNNGRDSIQREINKTFSGEQMLEDTLEKLNITEEEGSLNIRNHIKKLLK